MSLDQKEEKYEYFPDYKNAPYGLARLGPTYSYLDVFDKFPRGNPDPWCLSKVNNYICIGGSAASVSIILNLLKNFPIHYNLLRHVGAGVFGSVSSYFFIKNKELRKTREQAVLRHYVELHPERFPIIERKKYKDLILDWKVSRSY